MSDVIAYCSSDWHIPEEFDAPTWKDVPGVRGDVLHALSVVVGMCITDHVPLIAAGDLIDGPDISPEALAAWFDVLRPLAENSIPLLYVNGNHERSRDWLAAFGPSAVRLDGRVISLPSGHTVSGLSFTPTASLPAALANVSRVTDVGVYHQAIGEFGPGKGLSVTALPAHPLAIVGDTHVSKTLRPHTGPRLALSPGPLAPQTVAEFGPPGVWAITSDLSVRQVQIPARSYHRFDVGSPTQADACVAAISCLSANPKLPTHLQQPMIAVRLTADLDGFVPALRTLVEGKGFPLRVLDAGPGTVKGEEVPAGTRQVSADLATVVAAWPGLSPGARDLALALSDPESDPTSVLDADRAEWEADPDLPDGDVQDHDD